jgi:hypothetical protein
VDDVPVTLLAAQLGLELLGGVDVGLCGRGFKHVCLFGVSFVSLVLGVSYICIGVSVSFGVSVAVGIGCSRLNLRPFNGLSRCVLGFIQLSLSYLELLLRHLVSCFLIA